jgi:polyisoprenoid-binding protein YceI
MFHWYKILMKLKYLFSLPALLLALNCAQAEKFSLDSQQSRIQVAVSATIDSFVAHLSKYQADIDCETNSELPDEADVSFDFKDLKTGNPSRDKAMLKWLDHSATPSCHFVLSDWKIVGATNYAVGTIMIHGIKREIEMPVTVEHAGDRCDITGTADLNYRNFNLPIIRKMLLLTVDPNLHVSFHLVGTLTAK